MAIQSINADTAKSMMTLAGGILVFISTAWVIVNNRLAKARSAAAKERIIGTTLGLIAIGLNACGSLVLMFATARLVGAFLLLAGFIIIAFGYIRMPSSPSRLENVIVIMASANLVFMLVFVLFAPVIDRIVDVLQVMSKR